MKKLLSIVFTIVMLSCTVGQKPKEINIPSTCFSESSDAWRYFRDAANNKDTINLKKILSDKYPFDSLSFTKYENPILEVLMQEELGEYYINFEYEKGVSRTFVLVKDGTKRVDVRILEMRAFENCYQVYKFYKFGDTKKMIKYITKIQTTPKKKQYARVTTVADGYDVQVVNLWSSTDGDTRRMVGTCSNNERVEVLSYSDPYVYVRKSNGVKGYFMREFLK